jgi:hypothetical protein
VAEVNEVSYAQKLGEDGFYLKVDSETGEVLKKKTTEGPYKGIPIWTDEGVVPEEDAEFFAPPPVEEVKKNKVEEIPDRTFISLDDSIEKIVYLDKEGVDLFFEDDPGKFRELPEKVVDVLSKINRERYRTSRDINKRRVREEEHPEEFRTPGISVISQYATARNRLKVEGKRPGYHYAWKAPHELTQAARLGYRIAKHPGLETFSQEGEETHKVSAFGEDELVLTEVPEETYQAILKHHSDKSRRRVDTTEQSGAAEIRASGGVAFDPKRARKGLNWSRSPGPNLNEQ